MPDVTELNQSESSNVLF